MLRFEKMTGMTVLGIILGGCGTEVVERAPGEVIEALVRQEAQEIWTDGNAELIPQFYADTQVVHYGEQVLRLSHDAKREMLEGWRGSFPDLVMEVDDIVVSGDRAAVRYTVSGTHLGEFDGNAPTGETFRVEQVYFLRFEDGKIAETWGVWDEFGFYEQLGLLLGEG